MIRKYLLLVGVIVGMHLQNIADGNAYEALCTNVVAALPVPVERRSTDWVAYTNGLPAQAIQILLE